MAQRYRKFKRGWGMYYAFDNVTGNSVSLKTREKAEATIPNSVTNIGDSAFDTCHRGAVI